MARLAIVGLLSLALLVLQVSSQLHSGSGSGNDTDYDYYEYYDDGNTTVVEDHVWIEPYIPVDPTWADDLCLRYRDGAYV